MNFKEFPQQRTRMIHPRKVKRSMFVVILVAAFVLCQSWLEANDSQTNNFLGLRSRALKTSEFSQSLDLSSRGPAMMRLSPRLEETLKRSQHNARLEVELEAPPIVPLQLADFSRAHKFYRGQLIRFNLDPIESKPETSPKMSLPSHISVGDDFSRAMSKIVDHNVQNYLRGEAFRHSELGQMTKQIERSLSAGLSWSERSHGSAPVKDSTPAIESATTFKVEATRNEPAADQRIQHRLEVGLLAAQAQAKITYAGFTDAEVTYSAANQQLAWALREPLRENFRLVYNHVENRAERRDSLSLHLSW